MPQPLTWTTMLGLLAVTACSSAGKSSPTPSPSEENTRQSSSPSARDPSHPCYKQSNCAQYIRLPDGGAAPQGSTDAGTLTMCGPCNG